LVRVVIVEDEPLAAKFLESLLNMTGKVDVVGIARDAAWGLTLCSEHEPDAIFLDVRMPGQDGIGMAAGLTHLANPPLVVFTTGHDERACEAFRLEAVDYLLKPLEADQVWDAVCRIERRIQTSPGEQSLDNGSALPASGDRLPVKCLRDDIVKLIPRLDIVAAIHRDRRTWIHTASEEFATYYTVAEMLSWLGDSAFLRVSREGIVNLKTIEEVVHYGDRLYQVRIRDRLGTCINASRSGSVGLAALLKPPM
jgi:DNA-binding LytR/AlgR family response regulator